MSETIDQIIDRLENIRSVEPILGALRTIAMGNWKAALNRRVWAMEYANRISDITHQIYPQVKNNLIMAPTKDLALTRTRVTIFVIGSERGLCGAFNRVLAEHTQQYLANAYQCDQQVRLQVAGTRASRVLQRSGIVPEGTIKLSATAVPPFKMAEELALEWLGAYEAEELDRVEVIYNAYLGTGRYETRAVRLLPPEISGRMSDSILDAWPEPIIETNAGKLFLGVLLQHLTTRLYAYLLESSASENSARFQLLEDARQNTERLVEELETEAAQAYRQAITLEIQNLAVRAGLLDRN